MTPTLHSINFILILAYIPCFMGTSMAMDGGFELAGLPLSYQIEEVSVNFIQRTGSPSFPIRRIILTGEGSATLEQHGKSLLFAYASEDLLAILNGLYKIRFFELPEDYTTQYSVFLNNHKTIQATALRLAGPAT